VIAARPVAPGGIAVDFGVSLAQIVPAEWW
jgi:hypothetical protein